MNSGEGSEVTDDTEASLDPTYATHLLEHIRETLEHYNGSDGGAPLPPSFFPPNGFWTSAEKDAFFHGLIIHSRLRPDLIAAEIKTKTTADVCVYLDLLEEAASQCFTETRGHIDADTSRAAPVPRSQLPAAFEVSDDWVAVEEQKALGITRSETDVLQKELQEVRDEEVRLHRSRTRARKGEAKTPNGRDREGEKRRKKEFDQWLKEKKQTWEVEDLLGTLDAPAMQALDRILREDEKPRLSEASSESQRANSDSMRLGSANGGSSALPAQENQVQAISAPGIPAPTDATATMIDPVLLAMSGPPQVQLPLSIVPPPPVHSSAHFQPITPPFQTKPLPEIDHPTPAPDPLHVPDGPISLRNNEDVKPTSESDELARLSPVSRRRHQKKLYMRRKRAQATGAPIDETIQVLKPGRKGKAKATHLDTQTETDGSAGQQTASGGSSAPVHRPVLRSTIDIPPLRADLPDCSAHEREQSSTELSEQTRHPHVSGKTRTYKIGAQLAAVGIDADWLYDEGLALFRMNGLAKLMRLNSRLHDVPESACSQISIDTIKLLHLLVVQFLIQVICRAIVLEEQERVAKAHTKVWRMSDNEFVSAENVQRALALLGHEGCSKETYYGHLLGHYNDASDSDVRSGDDTRSDTHSESEDEDQGERASTSEPLDGSDMHDERDDGFAIPEANGGIDDTSCHDFLSTISTHRTIFSPIVRLPLLKILSSRQGLRQAEEQIYLPWPAPSYEDPESINEEELMSAQTDEEALAEELQDEEVIDERDRLLDEFNEKSVWAEFGGRRTLPRDGDSVAGPSRKRKHVGNGGEDEDVDESAAKRQRKLAPIMEMDDASGSE